MSTPHQSRYFGAFPECTQWDPFIRSDCWSLCFTLYSTHKHPNKDISAFSVSSTTHIFTCRAPRCEHNTFLCSFIITTEWMRKTESILWEVLFLQSNHPNADSGSKRSETGRESTDSSPGREWLQVSKYLGSSTRFMLMNWPDCDHPQRPFQTELGRNQTSYRGLVPAGLAGG